MCMFEDDDKYGKAIIETQHEVEKIKLEMVELRTYMKMMLGIFSTVGVILAGVLIKLFISY